MKSSQILLFVLFIFFLWATGTVNGASITVTTTEDIVEGSLRAAITTANGSSEDTVINLPAGTYILNGESRENDNKGGDLDIGIGKNVTIIGAGADTTIIDGNQIDRVFQILKDATLSVSKVTIKNGKAPGGFDDADKDPNGEDGGGIHNFGTLIIADCTITGNRGGAGSDSRYGHGGHGGGIYSNGNVTITNSTFSENRAGHGGYQMDSFDPDGGGGGIYNTGSLNIAGSIFSKNYSGGDGSCDSGGDGGGAVFNSGTLTLELSTLDSNGTGGGRNGGGISNKGTAVITGCTISNNKTGGAFGDGLYYCEHSAGNGGGISNTGFITLTRSLIYNNKTGRNNSGSIGTYAGSGGGIWNSGSASLTNCTVTGNSTGDGEIGSGGSGGGISTNSGMTIINCTVANNSLGQPGASEGEFGYYSRGGGISVGGTGIKIKNTIIADNRINSGQPGKDCYGNLDSQGYNLIEDIADCTVSGSFTGNIFGQDAQLTDLADNGGPTMTRNLLPGSPALDAGDSTGILIDQRGYTRPVDVAGIENAGDGSDIGALEAEYDSLPVLAVSRDQLIFGGDSGGKSTSEQSFRISNQGEGILDWTIDIGADSSWLSISPLSGTGNARVTVSVDTNGLAPGNYSAVLSVRDDSAGQSPRTVTVSLTVYADGSTLEPFGTFETPLDGGQVYGSIPVTGWVLDDIKIENVKIYREPVTGEGSGLVYIGDAQLVEGARPDVKALYPGYPHNDKAGWGYMLLTHFLPEKGNGTFTLHTVATDTEGNAVTLGTKTIRCDNENATNPFGAIDTPTQGGTASGTAFVNFGWALTPLPKSIPADGSTITVWIDGVPVGNPVYNNYREDIAALFPGYHNSSGAVGYFSIDTTKYEDGVHIIAWSVKDDAGATEGIGSRYFTIQNNSSDVQEKAFQSKRITTQPNFRFLPRQFPANPNHDPAPVKIRKGFYANDDGKFVYPDENGVITVEIHQLERLEIRLDHNKTGNYSGFLMTNGRLNRLPVGSSLDREEGVFRWMTGAAVLGSYQLVFVEDGLGRNISKTEITVVVKPKF